MKKQILISIAIVAVIFGLTAVIIIYGKGYFIDFSKGTPQIAGTGLLVATSVPDGAQVLVNGDLTTATNNTINLAPGTYDVEIFKEGYFRWKKTLTVQEEVVAKADAVLFPSTPTKLESITGTGVQNAIIDPSGEKIAFTVSSQSANRKNGVYIFNMNAGPLLTLQSGSTQIAEDTIGDLFSTAKLSWSPDSKNIVATISQGNRLVTYLLNANGFNSNPQNITQTLTNYQNMWNNEKEEKRLAQIAGLRANLKKVVTENFHIVSWSPDETKILYVASNSATLPLIINPPLIGGNSTPQERNIQKGSVYIYDTKEDKNYKILDELAEAEVLLTKGDFPFKWLKDSKHILYVHDKKVEVMEYDGLNKTTIYAGPFVDNLVFPWPGGGKFVIVTNLGNDSIAPNLYTVSLQ